MNNSDNATETANQARQQCITKLKAILTAYAENEKAFAEEMYETIKSLQVELSYLSYQDKYNLVKLIIDKVSPALSCVKLMESFKNSIDAQMMMDEVMRRETHPDSKNNLINQLMSISKGGTVKSAPGGYDIAAASAIIKDMNRDGGCGCDGGCGDADGDGCGCDDKSECSGCCANKANDERKEVLKSHQPKYKRNKKFDN